MRTRTGGGRRGDGESLEEQREAGGEEAPSRKRLWQELGCWDAMLLRVPFMRKRFSPGHTKTTVP